MSDVEWLEKVTGKFFSLFSKREVKTPLSFFFRVITAMLLVVLATLYLVVPDLRFQVFEVAMIAFVALFMSVYFFAWLKPKHLVYGETGHRAELKFALGTEQKEISAGNWKPSKASAIRKRCQVQVSSESLTGNVCSA